MYTHSPPAMCCNVSVFRSGNIAKDNANVTAFLAVLVIPLTNEPKCMVRAAPKFAPQYPNVQNAAKLTQVPIDPLGPLTRKEIPCTSSPDVKANKKDMPVDRSMDGLING